MRTAMIFHTWSKQSMIEMIIVGTIGVGYAVVGTLQWLKGDMGAGIMWIGYAFAQIGLFLNLK